MPILHELGGDSRGSEHRGARHKSESRDPPDIARAPLARCESVKLLISRFFARVFSITYRRKNPVSSINSQLLWRERPAPARNARAGCPRPSGRDAHATCFFRDGRSHSGSRQGFLPHPFPGLNDERRGGQRGRSPRILRELPPKHSKQGAAQHRDPSPQSQKNTCRSSDPEPTRRRFPTCRTGHRHWAASFPPNGERRHCCPRTRRSGR